MVSTIEDASPVPVMRMTVRKVTQVTALAAVVLMYMLFLSIERTHYTDDQTSDPLSQYIPEVDGYQERAPRSIEVQESVQQSKVGLEDIFISVKTSKQFHQKRLDLILRTWFTLAPEQTYFFSDAEDEEYQKRAKGHLINTNCSSSHSRKALCCKMSVEFDLFLKSDQKWFCHFDDDNYVNVPKLVDMLQSYSPQDDWYLGKPSIRRPLKILDRQSGRDVSFWFATGGAGFCLSRSLALKMLPIASGGKFITVGEKIRLPDDVTIGYIVEHMLKKNLTVIEKFHSHLEPMKYISQQSLQDQITFSYSKYGQEMNVVELDGIDTRADPTRFLSIHCKLFGGHVAYCPAKIT